MKREELEKEGWEFEKPPHVAESISLFDLNVPAFKGLYKFQIDTKNKRIRIKKDKEIIFLGVCETIEDFKNICNKNKIY